MNGPSYLCLAGNEISNELRTLSYLRRGLAGPGFDVATNGQVSDISGYSDIYSDIYGGDVSYASTLACYCADLDDPSNFHAPISDPAPWYDSQHAGAGDFLGIIFHTIDLAPASQRTVTARSSAGGSVGRLRVKSRVIQFAGTMYAANGRGMEYGKRWLVKALAGSICGDCGGDDAELLPACSDGSGLSGFRILHEVGLVDGPVFSPPANKIPADRITDVSFQLVAGNPYLHTFLESAARTMTLPPATSGSVAVTTTQWSGDVAVKIEITAVGGPLRNCVIQAVPVPQGATCGYDPSQVVNTCARYVIGYLADGDTITIDATSERVYLTDNTSKSITAGFEALDFDGPFPWLIVPPCSTTCVSIITATGTALVHVTQEEREL